MYTYPAAFGFVPAAVPSLSYFVQAEVKPLAQGHTPGGLHIWI